MTALKNKILENKYINISILSFMIKERQKVLGIFLKKKKRSYSLKADWCKTKYLSNSVFF